MNQLTPEQVIAIENLCNNPSISFTQITYRKDSTLVAVSSTVDADWNTVDNLVDDIFPTMVYRGKPYKSFDNDKKYELYIIDDGETKVEINIHMIKSAKEVDKHEN